jgi:hypothetical protein
MKIRSRALTLVSLLVGLGLFVWLVRQTGVADILARVRALGVGFLLILAISSIRQFVRALAWLRCMTPEDRHIGILALVKARLAGDAIGDLTTAGPLIAEPLKVMTLGDRLSTGARISSLAVENLAYAFSSCVMVMAGTLALLAFFAVSESLRAAGRVAIGATLIALTAAILIISRRWHLLSSLTGALLRLLKREEKWKTKRMRVREIEDYIFDFYARRPADFMLVALCEIGFHLAGVLEIYTTLNLTGDHTGWSSAFILEAVNRVINIAFAFVPAMVGVDEAGTGLLAQTLGLGAAAGVTLAIIRKARMFFWIGLGLVFLGGSRNSEFGIRKQEEKKS